MSSQLSPEPPAAAAAAPSPPSVAPFRSYVPSAASLPELT